MLEFRMVAVAPTSMVQGLTEKYKACVFLMEIGTGDQKWIFTGLPPYNFLRCAIVTDVAFITSDDSVQKIPTAVSGKV